MRSHPPLDGLSVPRQAGQIVRILDRSLAVHLSLAADHRDAGQIAPSVCRCERAEVARGEDGASLQAPVFALPGDLADVDARIIESGLFETGEEALHLPAKRRMIVLEREKVVGIPPNNRGRNGLLTSDSVDRHRCATNVK